MRLLSALRRGLGQIKIRILLGYFAILLIPFLLILHSLISSVYERGCEQRQNILNNSLSNYASIIEQYAIQAVYAADAVQSNQFLTDILSCNIFSVSDEVYTYYEIGMLTSAYNLCAYRFFFRSACPPLYSRIRRPALYGGRRIVYACRKIQH